MLRHVNIKIYGLVHGVSFRYYSRMMAEQLNIRGFAENRRDCVYIEAEGEERAIEEFISWCHHGPSFANVEKVEVEEGALKRYQGFFTK